MKRTKNVQLTINEKQKEELMKKIFGFCIFAFGFALAFVLSGVAFAQGIEAPVTNEELIGAILNAIGGNKGASALVIAGVVVQILIKFMKTPWAGEIFKKVSKSWQLAIIYGLSVIASIVGIMTSGGSFGMAITSGTVMAALMVFGNQIWKASQEGKVIPLQSV